MIQFSGSKNQEQLWEVGPANPGSDVITEEAGLVTFLPWGLLSHL